MSLHLYLKQDMTSNTEYTKMRNVKDCYVGDVNFIIN